MPSWFGGLLLTFAAAVPDAYASTTVVHPTGVYPQDVQNVQAALDGGGTVLLKATSGSGAPTRFNFGPSQSGSGFVVFHRDAELTGERLAGADTVIEGGSYPVEAFGEAASVAVRNIRFHAPYYGALLLYGADTEVTGARISHVVGTLLASGRTIAEAVVVGFSGRVLVEDNVITDVFADLGFGISQFRAAGPVVIRRNTISDTGYGAIESSFNVSAATGVAATVSITDNHLRPGPAPSGFGVGIEVNGEGAYYLADNEALIESPVGLGVYALGAPQFGIAPMIAPVVQRNDVVLQPVAEGRPVFADGIDLVGTVSRAYLGQNSVRGTGFSALGAYDVAAPGSDLGFNTFVGNQIAPFQALVADVFLDTATHDTVLLGDSRTVLDFGTNNRITGVAPISASGRGQQVSEATRLRNEAMQETIARLRAHGAMP
jgi:sorbitol-specific phosphotransferase system component IIA